MARIRQFVCRIPGGAGTLEATLCALAGVRSSEQAAGLTSFLDTFDRRLRASALILQCDTVGEHACLNLRADGGRELAGLALTSGCPRHVRDLPPAALRERLEPIVGRRALLAFSQCRSVRRSYDWRAPGGDHVGKLELIEYLRVPAGQSLTLLVIAPDKGHGAEARALASVLEAHLPLTACDGDPARLLDGEPADGATDPRAADATSGSTPIAAVVTDILLGLAATMRACEPGIVDDVDCEFLHDYRVALRRARALSAAFKRLFAADAYPRFRGDLAWLGAGTSRLRDLDVLEDDIAQGAARASAPATPAQAAVRAFVSHQRKRELERVRRLFARVRYTRFVDEWEDLLVAMRGADLTDDTPLEIGAGAAIRRAYDRVIRRVEALEDGAPPVAALHELRKDCKRLRYLVEGFATLYPPRRLQRIQEDLKSTQDILGDICDRRAQVVLLRAWQTAPTSRGALAAGLAELLAAREPRAGDARSLKRALGRLTGEKCRARFARLWQSRSA